TSADRAISHRAYDDAANVLRRALDAAAHGGTPEERCEIETRLADVLCRCGELEKAESVALDALALARRTRQPELIARAALAGPGPPLGFSVTRYREQVFAALREALDVLEPADGALRAQTMARLSEELVVSRGPSSSTLAREAVAMARRLGDPSVL